MSSLYRPLPELVFSTPWFRKLGAAAKLVVITLAAGPCATGCPGLAIADAYTLVSLVGLGVSDVEAALGELVKVGAVEMDDDHRLMRLPWCPRMRTTASEKTLRGWFGVWKELPDCAMKFAHVVSVRDGADFGGKGMEATWVETFGAAKPFASPPDALPKGMPSPTDHEDEDEDEDVTKTKTNTNTNMPAAPGVSVPLKLVAAEPKPRFDLDAIYAAYPRKEGKAKGLEKLKTEITTDAEYEAVMLGARRYAAAVKSAGTETQHVAHFSTWVNGRRWEDQPDIEARPTNGAARRGPTPVPSFDGVAPGEAKI